MLEGKKGKEDWAKAIWEKEWDSLCKPQERGVPQVKNWGKGSSQGS